MRKLILFFTVVGLGLAMTSCLDGNQNFSESSVVYISMDQGLVYGKTLSGKLITSDKIKMLEPGTFNIISYSWEESYGYTAFGQLSVYNVITSGEVTELEETSLQMTPVVEVTPKVYFKEIKILPYDPDGLYFDDYWLFPYTYSGKKGEIPVVTFNKREQNTEKPDYIEIDIRIAKSGTPEAGASETLFPDIIAVDMAQLRHTYEGTSTTSTKDLKIKFYYYLDGKEDLTSLQQEYIMRVRGN